MTWQEIHSRSQLSGYDPPRLFESSVAVIGAGALGQNVALNLALAGVGSLRVVDFDVFEPHNATRSPLYPDGSTQQLLGLGKSETVAHALRQKTTAPTATVEASCVPVQQISEGDLRRASVIVSAVDSQEARAYLSEFGRLYNVPVVEGGFRGDRYSLTIDFGDPFSACYRCTNPEREGSFSCTQYAMIAEEAEIVPAIQNTAAVLGGLVAEAVIQLLHGEGSSFTKAVGSIRSLGSDRIAVDRDPQCPGIHRTVEIQSVSIDKLSSLGDVLDQIPEQFDAIRFIEPFIAMMSCRDCGTALKPMVRQSVWLKDPYCSECSATAGHTSVPGLFVPIENVEFSRDDIARLAIDALPLDRFGIGIGSRVLATSSISSTACAVEVMPA